MKDNYRYEYMLTCGRQFIHSVRSYLVNRSPRQLLTKMCNNQVLVTFAFTVTFLSNITYSYFENDYILTSPYTARSSSFHTFYSPFNNYNVAPRSELPITKQSQDSTSTNYVFAPAEKYENEVTETTGQLFSPENFTVS